MRTTVVKWITVASLMVLGILITACAAPQDTSKSYSRALVDRGAIVPADAIRVAEYLNYYEQRFPEPVDEPLALDVRLGNPQTPVDGGEVWVQIGVQARPAPERERTPLNLALVLDTSGSMADPDKMPYLKESLRVFLGSLQPDDIVSIVGYSNDAYLIRSAQAVGDGYWIRQAIASLTPDGSTNLHAGLMLGFSEVDRNYDIRRNNRVILLSDGIANEGVMDPAAIAADALAYTDRGIYLSTVGLGLDFNDDLLSALARQGRGAYHFIDSAQEMDKVFRQEVAGLVERVANDVAIGIEPEPGVVLTAITGLEGTPPAAGVRIRLPDMGAGESQVVLARFRVTPGPIGPRSLAAITLDYSDVFAQRPRQIGQAARVQAADLSAYDPLADVEVRRNATIVRSAEALKSIDALFTTGRYLDAWNLAAAMENELRSMAQLADDAQLVQDADLFRRYQHTLAQALGYDPVQRPRPSPVDAAPPQRWGAKDPQISPLPTIELR